MINRDYHSSNIHHQIPDITMDDFSYELFCKNKNKNNNKYKNKNMQLGKIDEDDMKKAAYFLLALKHSSSKGMMSPFIDSFLLRSNNKIFLDTGARQQSCAVSSTIPAPPTSSSSRRQQKKHRNTFHSYEIQASELSTTQLQPVLNMSLEDLIAGSTIVTMEDHNLVPDSLLATMGQMKRCKLTVDDKAGSYKLRDIGFNGFCCKHCGGKPGFGRYYPNSKRSLAQTTTSKTIMKHVVTKCKCCPQAIRDAIIKLQKEEENIEENNNNSGKRPRYGSRKIFFERVWSRLHHDAPLSLKKNEVEARNFDINSEEWNSSNTEMNSVTDSNEISSVNTSDGSYDNGDQVEDDDYSIQSSLLVPSPPPQQQKQKKKKKNQQFLLRRNLKRKQYDARDSRVKNAKRTRQ